MEALTNLYQSQRRWMNAVLGIAIVTLFWSFANWQVNSELFFVGPWRVVTYTYGLFASGEILDDLRISGTEFFWGFGVAAFAGIALGMIFGISRVFREFFDPWLSAVYATPSVALAPLIIIWFGVDLTAKIVIVLITAVVPIVLNTYTGVMRRRQGVPDAGPTPSASPRIRSSTRSSSRVHSHTSSRVCASAYPGESWESWWESTSAPTRDWAISCSMGWIPSTCHS